MATSSFLGLLRQYTYQDILFLQATFAAPGCFDGVICYHIGYVRSLGVRTHYSTFAADMNHWWGTPTPAPIFYFLAVPIPQYQSLAKWIKVIKKLAYL